MKGKGLTSRILSIILCIFIIIGNINTLDVDAATKNTKSNICISSKAILQVGQSTSISIKKSSGVTVKKVTYSSNKKSVATVTSRGKITAKKVGKAYIYSTVKYVKNKKVYTTKLKTTVVVKRCPHKKFVIVKNIRPTCTKSGKKQIRCKQCGYVKTATIKAPGHKYGKGTVTKAATCKATGTKVYTCNVCKFKKSVVVPKTTAHKWNSNFTIDKQPTKIADGSKSIHCSVCNIIKPGSSVSIPKLAECTHVYDDGVVTKEATCTENGIKTYTCTLCKSTKIEIIPKIDHNFTEWTITKESTCTEVGEKTRACKICDFTEKVVLDKKEHSLITSSFDSTCSTHGKIFYTCTICHNQIKTEELPLDSNNHSGPFIDSTIDPTCISEGKEDIICKGCNKVISTRILPKVAHNYSNTFTIDKNATCSKTGTKSKHCITPGCTAKSEITTIPMTAHTKISANNKVVTTCTTSGKESDVICSVCKKIIFTGKAIPALGHSYDSGRIIKDATCTTDGTKKYTCTRCNATKIETIPALGHNYSTKYTVDKAATCSSLGSKSYHCSRCSAKTNITKIPMKEHSWDSGKVTAKPTCTKTGVKTYTCTICKKATKTETIQALGHKYSDEYITDLKPTCTKRGSKSRHCIRCESKTDVTVIPLTKHNYNSGKVTAEPTCVKTGVKTYICTGCGDTKTEIIKALGHNYSANFTIDKEPTCIAVGSKSRHCTRCNANIDVTAIDKIGHTYSSNVTKDATCINSGTVIKTCKVCGYSEIETIPALGHNYSSEYTIDKEPTCVSEGIKSRHCTRCNNKTDITRINTTDHIYDTVPIFTKPANCLCEGYNRYKCKNCDNTKEEYIPKLTSHKYDSDGICIYCGIGDPSIYAKSINISDNKIPLYANYKALNEKALDGTDLYDVIVKGTNEYWAIIDRHYSERAKYTYIYDLRHVKPEAFANDHTIKSVSFLSNTIDNVTYSVLFNTDSCSRMFYDCKNLKYVDLTGTNIRYVEDGTEMFSKSGIEDTANIKTDGHGVKNCTRMFADCGYLKYATSCDIMYCPSNTEYAFENCDELVKVKRFCINGSAKGMFKLCTNLSNVQLFGVITNLDETFMYCTYLSSVEIDSLTYVKSMYRTFYYNIRLQYIDDINLGEYSAKDITNFTETFYGCKYLTSLDLSMISSNENIAEMNGTFNGCTKLTTIYTKDGVFTDNFISKLQASGNAKDIWKNCGTNTFTVKTK